MNGPLLEVDDLRVGFPTDSGELQAVRGLSYRVDAGEVVAMVGESGSGKSAAAMAVIGLLPGYATVSGSVRLSGQQLLGMPDAEFSRIRGARIGTVFQDPMSALTPVYTVGDQIAEAIELHQRTSRRQALGRATEMLELVGIPEPALRLSSYPHQMSGGMRQRVMIAMALSCNPKLLIADEPTTALDVTIQAQILDLMRKLQRDLGMAILFITHDLGVVAEMADRVVVMYAGQAVEESGVRDIFGDPKMPYTLGLMNSIPRLHRAGGVAKTRLQAIPGNVPNPLELPPGCKFRPRCRFAEAPCAATHPPLEDAGDGRKVRCMRWTELDLKGTRAHV